MDSKKPPICESWWRSIWKLKVPPRMWLLMWKILRNKIPIRENLSKRSFHRPFWCYLCKSDNKIVDHLFLICPTVKDLWGNIHSHLPSVTHWQGSTVREAWGSWWSAASLKKARNIHVLTCWAIWITRNRYIFHNSPPHWSTITTRILSI